VKGEGRRRRRRRRREREEDGQEEEETCPSVVPGTSSNATALTDAAVSDSA
jgi:hypothetical protein